MAAVSKRQQIAGILLFICAVLLPVGVRYHTLATIVPGPMKYIYHVEFWIPIVIELNPGGWSILLFSSALGVFLPIFALAHIWVAMQGIEMARGRAVYCGIRNAVLMATLVSVMGFFPTFRMDWGNVPVPLILVVGLLLAKWGIPPPSDDPFEELHDN
jgi:predicted permease